MTRQRLWLALFVLSANLTWCVKMILGIKPKMILMLIIVYEGLLFTSCIAKCDCISPECYNDNFPPEPFIQFTLVDQNGKSWINVQKESINRIDSLKLFNEQGKELFVGDTTYSLGCLRDNCFKFDETPSRETINKFVSHKYFLKLHFTKTSWDTDTLLISYKTGALDCTIDSIKFKYNNSFSFVGLNQSRDKNHGFDVFNTITKL